MVRRGGCANCPHPAFNHFAGRSNCEITDCPCTSVYAAPPILDLPEYAQQYYWEIHVQTMKQAMDVLQYVPESLEDFNVIILDREESDKMARLLRGFGLR